ncbi:MAG TPA: biotin/lipoyl-containing protein, partial [Thermoanaerobaculia bacterium]|nr:biotin/lipoyl-containing protein [Thermoanaerobaculia bacterium]
MAEIIMPKMGDAMTEGKVVRWYKKPGDAVKKGEPVAEIETDKVNLDLEAEGEGTLGEYAANEGDVVPVGGVLARILGAGEKEEAPQQRRATDKKDSVKHTTGEYQEAIEQKGPRR